MAEWYGYSSGLRCSPVNAGAAIDLASLVVLEGKLCWMLYFDGLVLSSDGNLLDALSIAMKVGFVRAKIICLVI